MAFASKSTHPKTMFRHVAWTPPDSVVNWATGNRQMPASYASPLCHSLRKKSCVCFDHLLKINTKIDSLWLEFWSIFFINCLFSSISKINVLCLLFNFLWDDVLIRSSESKFRQTFHPTSLISTSDDVKRYEPLEKKSNKMTHAQFKTYWQIQRVYGKQNGEGNEPQSIKCYFCCKQK